MQKRKTRATSEHTQTLSWFNHQPVEKTNLCARELGKRVIVCTCSKNLFSERAHGADTFFKVVFIFFPGAAAAAAT
jgi:hypothetical protein